MNMIVDCLQLPANIANIGHGPSQTCLQVGQKMLARGKDVVTQTQEKSADLWIE
jgi:hypothetical protein